MNEIPDYNIQEIELWSYSNQTRNIILSNLKNYTKLKKFNCSICNLTKLPELPNSLTLLNCGNNKLTELPVLPNSLIKLDCGNNKLIKLPKLPNKLTHLYCNNNNNLTELPDLPNLLEYLGCHYNKLIKLPDLPNSLTRLMCYNNNLTKLPDLPNSLIELNCKFNNLTYHNLEIKTINKTNLKNKIIKRMQLLDRTLLLEHSAMITMNPKRIQRLLDNHEIDFFDGSFNTLTI